MTSNNLNKRVLYIATAAVVILFSGHALQTILPYTVYMILMAAAVTFPFTAQEIVQKNLNMPRWALLALTVMVGLTLIRVLGASFLTYAFMLAVIFVAYRVSESFEFEDVMSIFLSTMTFVTLVSLVGYILVNTGGTLSFLPVYKNFNGIEYAVGIVFNYILSAPERNCGMFWEPGMFATLLTYAIVVEIAFNKSKPRLFRLIVYSAGILTANSTAGFVLLALALILLIARNRNDKHLYYIASGLVLLVLILSPIVILNLDTIINSTFLGQNQYIQKLLSENLKEQTRIMSFATNFEIFLENPFFGAGIIPNEMQNKYVADTSTSTFLLASFGILGALYTVYLIYGVLRQKNLNTLSKIIVVVILLIIVNKEPHHQILFTWCLIFFMLKSDELSVTTRKERSDEDASQAEKSEA